MTNKQGLPPYPRHGYPLAPRLLEPLLRKSITVTENGTKQTILLCDLDASVWERWSSDTCNKLGRRVIRQVRKSIRNGLPASIANRYVSRPSQGMCLSGLFAEPHALKALKRLGYAEAPAHIGDLTIQQFLSIRGVGAGALVDFLSLMDAKEINRHVTETALPDTPVQAQLPGYPRAGQTLAPELLRPILQREITFRDGDVDHTIKLADLGSGSWKTFSAGSCTYLATQVVDEVRVAISRGLPPEIAQTRLPMSPGLRLSDLELGVRTYHAVLRIIEPGGEDDLSKSKLVATTLGEFVARRSVGPKSLVDVLSSLEHAGATIGSTPYSAADQGKRSSVVVATELGNKVRRSTQRIVALEVSGNIFDDDPRFARQLQSIETLAGIRASQPQSLREIGTRILECGTDLRTNDALQSTLVATEKSLVEANSCSLERELQEILEAIAAGTSRDSFRRAEMTVRRLGWGGQSAATLQDVGDEFGVTRERVRQVTKKVVDSIGNHTLPYAPVLDSAIGVIEAWAPASAQKIEESLLQDGLTESRFEVSGILDAAARLGRSVSVVQIATSRGSLVVDPVNQGLIVEAYRLARKSVQKWGAINVDDLKAQLEDSSSRNVDANLLLTILESHEDVHWLDRETGWFWISSVPPYRNRMRNNMAKILSVCPEIDVTDLRRALSRHHRTEGIALPHQILLELCRQLPEYRVNGSVVAADPRLNWLNVLADTEATMVLVLEEHGPLVARSEFEKVCLDLGIPHPTFYAYLGYSPVISRYASGVYGLVGAKVPPSDVQSLIPRRRRSNVIADYGWTEDGLVWIAYELSEASVRNGVLGLPASLVQIVQGDFEALASRDARVGTVAVKDTAMWGVGPYFRRRGGDAGDMLVMRFDLAQRVVHLQLGDEELLDELS